MLLVLLALCACAAARPHIVIIVADDLGWNDVGFHGSNQVPTPSLDALAYSGVLLHNYYVSPICTPSRAALMTGKYPIHTGMQHGVIYGMEPRGLPLSETLLPQHLQKLGYRTHLVGKWHLGHYKKEYLPLNRGFESHTGFWTGRIDLYDHTSMEHDTWGTDFRRGMQVAHDLFGKYATDIYTDEAIKVITAHNKSEPLFLMVAHSAMHSGNPNEFIRAPDSEIERFKHIENYQRRKFAAVLSKLDQSVGKVVESLHGAGLLNDTIILFTTDNGGPAAGFNDNAASNYPLRGVKATLWEGGVRGAGLLWSPLLQARARVARQLVHIADWLPSLISAAGGDASLLENIDGLDLWQELCKDQPSKRTSVVHNIDNKDGSAITMNHWKLHTGTSYNGAWDSWYGPAGRNGSYDLDAVFGGTVGTILGKMDLMPTREKAGLLRKAATIQCSSDPEVACKPLLNPCLFNIRDDPCERVNLASKNPQIVQRLQEELRILNQSVVPPNNKPDDPRGDPKFWGRVFTNFGDYEIGNGSQCL
ncbi:arylsulfatase I [Cydia amplana]|uniref:arylsulfatase I n=1 Tax=Cydia amplana TaxID=1869771 RepID=UPI002FE6AA8A